jgi:hypothetical protein
MPRFVILIHDHPFPHWDFLLENGDRCRTWRLPVDPGLPSTEFQAEGLTDHRLMYLDYEGPVSGGRGTVVRWDSGTFEWDVNEPGHCEVRLVGHRWRGLIFLKQVDGDAWHGTWTPEPTQ